MVRNKISMTEHPGKPVAGRFAMALLDLQLD
jgi:hypothetical protein